MEKQQQFSAGEWLKGAVLALTSGLAVGVIALAIAESVGTQSAGMVFGVIPGIILIAISRSARRNGFAQGMLFGGCIVVLLGGLCGSMVGMRM